MPVLELRFCRGRASAAIWNGFFAKAWSSAVTLKEATITSTSIIDLLLLERRLTVLDMSYIRLQEVRAEPRYRVKTIFVFDVSTDSLGLKEIDKEE